MLRLSSHPESPDLWPEPYLVWDRPADLQWSGEIPEGAVFQRRDDGAVHLSMDKLPQSGWMAVPLPHKRVRFIEVEVDEVAPGAQL